jgi:DNA-binding LytR/AlgR family response regulator
LAGQIGYIICTIGVCFLYDRKGYLSAKHQSDFIVGTEMYARLKTRFRSLFKRIHRSYIISVSKIVSCTAEIVELKGASIPIARGYRDILENLLEEWLTSQGVFTLF